MELTPTLYRFGEQPAITGTLRMFDMDGTIIVTASGAKHPKSVDDWKWRGDALARLVALASPFVIVTNQAGANSQGNNLDTDEYAGPIDSMALQRVAAVYAALRSAGCTVVIYAAIGRDGYRKPSPCIFTQYIAPACSPTSIYYIGDAAGRPGDFSDSDRGFAYNIHLVLRNQSPVPKLRFCTPEEYFDGAPIAARSWRRELPVAADANNVSALYALAFARVIIMVGAPGSGKSTLAAMLAARFHGETFSNDDHRNAATTIAAASAYGAAPKSGPVIIDNTHPTETLREPAIALAAKLKLHGYKDERAYVILYLDYPKDLVTYLNDLRTATGGRHVPAVAIRTYYKRLEPPSGPHVLVWNFQPTVNKSICPWYGMRL